MITLANVANIKGERCEEYRGLSTDSKPTTGVANGSVFIEMNTGKVYFFNADSSAWVEFGA